VQANRDYFNNGATPKPGYIPYTYPHPLVTDISTPLTGDETALQIKDYKLSQNYPNPFNPVTTIRYEILETNKVTLKIYDVTGREAATLVNEVKDAGRYEVRYDALHLSSGIYLYQLKAGNFVKVKKLMLIK
jgi:hypothetical protein